MNKQRNVLITITYNEMGIIIDTKAEEVAQPNLQPTCNNLATDTISRQALCEYALNQKDKSVTPNDIMRFPSAQPEIIHCGDCRYKDDGIDEDGIPFLKCLNVRSYGGTIINGFCSWAERRTDG